jgi:hypothetical protein
MRNPPRTPRVVSPSDLLAIDRHQQRARLRRSLNYRLGEALAVTLLAALLGGLFWWSCGGAVGRGSPAQNPTMTRVPLTSDRAR